MQRSLWAIPLVCALMACPEPAPSSSPPDAATLELDAGAAGPDGGTPSDGGAGLDAGAVPPDWQDDFTSYTDTAHFNASEAPAGQTGWFESFTSGVSLDRTQGVNGNSMRYDWPVTACNQDQTVSRTILVRPTRTELWFEAWTKASPNFSIVGAGCSNNHYKFLHFVTIPDGQGRFGIGYSWSDTSSMTLETPDPYYSTAEQGIDTQLASISDLKDGAWHRVRAHIRISGGNALFEVWTDDDYYSLSQPTDATSIQQIDLGANMNSGPSQEQQNWWSAVRLWWTEDPGW